MTFLSPINPPRIIESKRPVIIDWDLAFEHPKAAQACAYWQSRRAGRAMPERADLQFSAMASFVAHVALVEVRASADARTEYFIRLAGSQCEIVFGNVSGHITTEVVPPNIEQRWRSVFDAVVDAKLPLRVSAGVEFADKVWLQMESFVAPLGQDENVAMLFVCFTASDIDPSRH
jgi:hypothetical protein